MKLRLQVLRLSLQTFIFYLAKHLRGACLLAALGSVAIFSSAQEPDSALDPVTNPAIDVVITTDRGNILVALHPETAPVTVENFLGYVDQGFYDGTIFHRVIPQFMIQGGGMTADMVEKPGGEPIKNESRNRMPNMRGTIAMARTNNPDSATNQFFINVRMNNNLNYRMGRSGQHEYGYTVFGKVKEGMDVVDEIVRQRTHSRGGLQNVPVEPIFIQSIKRLKQLTPAAETPSGEKAAATK